MIDFRSATIEELEEYVTGKGYPRYVASQLFSWFHKNPVASFDEMTNISKKVRQTLSEDGYLSALTIKTVQESPTDHTRKYLWRLPDGNYIESVYMIHDYGYSICISTEVGCKMGCRFCASTIGGLVRSLTPAEMLEQIYETEKDVGQRISHVVLMGSGEPLNNYDAVVKFLRLITSPAGHNLSARNITLSTCGLTEEIRRLAAEQIPATLAISLHAPNDAIRKTLLPIAYRYTIREVIDAADYYFQETGRRISYEYALVAGYNDGEENARELGRLLKGHAAHVNLILVNPVSERDYEKPTEETAAAFRNILENAGINATIRKAMGRDIDGACGQLRYRVSKEEDKK